jgi:hypothetical protein
VPPNFQHAVDVRLLTIGVLNLSKPDDQVLGLDFNTRDVAIDGGQSTPLIRAAPERRNDQPLDLHCRHPTCRSGALTFAIEKLRAHGIPVRRQMCSHTSD